MGAVVYRPDHPDANENGMVPVEIAGPKNIKLGTSAYVISDNLGAHLRHMATGRYHDSKSEFRKDTKASGCVEVGNEATAKPRKWIEPPAPGADIKRAIEQLRSR